MNNLKSTFWRYVCSFGSLPYVYRLITKTSPYLMGLAVACLGLGIMWGLFFTPADYQQGDAFRIIYIHVPAAFFSLSLYAAMGFASLAYLIWRVKLWDMVALSIAPVGALFTVIALITGSVWGKPMWGTYWIWDARLTSELILCFLYLGYLGLYHSLKAHPNVGKIVAVLAVVGLLDLPVIHYSVTWWSTLHQGSTVVKLKPSIAPEMLWPLLITLAGFAFYAAWLVCVRVQNLIRERESRAQWLKECVS